MIKYIAINISTYEYYSFVLYRMSSPWAQTTVGTLRLPKRCAVLGNE